MKLSVLQANAHAYVVCFFAFKCKVNYKPNESYFLTLACKTLKENCKSLSKCGELNQSEEKINVKLMTGTYNQSTNQFIKVIAWD